MTHRERFGLFLVSLVILGFLSAYQTAPGYMDADYYFAVGWQIASGEGYVEPFLWNFLSDPEGLPTPAFAYWMPLASWVAVVGMILTGVKNFFTARLGFLLVAALIPPLTGSLAYELSGQRRAALLAGGLALFPGFYLPFLTTTDTFAIFMVIGALVFLLLPRFNGSTSPWVPFVIGVLLGWMHLARVDGFLWLLALIVLICIDLLRDVRHQRELHAMDIGDQVKRLSTCIGGYLLVITPWMIRNWVVFGSLTSPGGSRMLWLTDYNQLYAYPASQLRFETWWASGLTEILKGRLWALRINLQRSLAEQGMIFLMPLILLAIWVNRRDLRVRLGTVGWILFFCLMTVIFPFAGARGGYFHSGAALQPLFFALASMGLGYFVSWGQRVRGWKESQAFWVFGSTLVVFAVLLSAYVFFQQVIGGDVGDPVWGDTVDKYIKLDAKLNELGAGPDEVVLVNNPPGYFIASSRQAIAVPDGDLDTVITVAKRYQATYLLLEENHPVGLTDLYKNPGNRTGLRYLLETNETHVFIVE